MPKNYMSDENFEMLIQSIKEGADFDKEGTDLSNYRVTIPPTIDVKKIRSRLNMTQSKFAETFGFSIKSVQFWEQGRRTPEASARAFLKLIGRAPEFVVEILKAA